MGVSSLNTHVLRFRSTEGSSDTCTMASSSGSDSELSSDEELQIALAEGTLKPGLVGEVAPPKTYTNNVSGLREALAVLKRKGQSEWLERMDITCREIPQDSGSSQEAEKQAEEKELDPNDDFKREMWFYQQAMSALEVGQRKLEEFGIPTTRPDDYFAEMVKTDDHMRKVRERLLSRQKGLEQREKTKKLRELKKFGKKVQQDILQKRREDKKKAINSIRKGKGEKTGAILHGRKRDVEKEEEEFAVSASREEEGKKKQDKMGRKGGGPGKGKSKKRLHKDKRFGFGGKKRGQKKNNAQSAGDMSSFSSARHSKIPSTKKPSARNRNKSQSSRNRGNKK